MIRKCDYCGQEYDTEEAAKTWASVETDEYCSADCEYYGRGWDADEENQ